MTCWDWSLAGFSLDLDHKPGKTIVCDMPVDSTGIWSNFVYRRADRCRNGVHNPGLELFAKREMMFCWREHVVNVDRTEKIVGKPAWFMGKPPLGVMCNMVFSASSFPSQPRHGHHVASRCALDIHEARGAFGL